MLTFSCQEDVQVLFTRYLLLKSLEDFKLFVYLDYVAAGVNLHGFRFNLSCNSN